MFEVATQQDMEKALAQMTEDQRDHLKLVITELMQCYLDDSVHGMLLVGKDGARPLKLISINATDMEAASLMLMANDIVNYAVLEDAPPKEKFN